MGAITLPLSGPIYAEASPIIYAVEKIEPYAALLEPVWRAAQSGQFRVVTGELTWLEVLTKPLRHGYRVLEGLFRDFLTAKEVDLAPATLPIWEHAARLRALGLKTPDALHPATAVSCGCTLSLTKDSGFTRVPGLPVEILSVVLAS